MLKRYPCSTVKLNVKMKSSGSFHTNKRSKSDEIDLEVKA